MSDPLQLLGTLPAAEPDAARSRRVRQRCHATLARGAAARRAGVDDPRPRWHTTWAAVMAGLGALYVAEVLVLASEVLGTR